MAKEKVRSDKKTTDSMIGFMQSIICQLRQQGKIRTSETYSSALNSFMRFRGDKNVSLKKINSDLMMAYEVYLKSERLSMNTISFYMRILCATYNRAVASGKVKQCYPFRYVYTGIDKTQKRSISFLHIKQIKELDLSSSLTRDFARDLFLFSLYTRGMSFIDIAFLQKKDLKNGVLSYRRQKTGQRLFIKWELCMQYIIDKYPSTDSPYLLPIIKRPGNNERRQYKSTIFLVNRYLKEIGEKIQLSIPLTMYVARHSWANIARSRNVSISLISQSMGHSSEKMTQIYLNSLDMALVDQANSIVLKGL